MSTYREIHGKAIKSVSTDPSATTDEGQIWYNTSSNTFKSIVNLESWSSGGPLSTGRYNLTGVGTNTAGLAFGGDTGPPPEVRRAETEEYNGSGWASTPNLNTARDLTAGFGIQTAAATAGGRSSTAPSGTNITEEYDGSSWTNVPGTLNTTRFGAGGFGTQTAGVACGGTPPTTNATEEYNGSAWTNGNNMNNSVSSLQSETAGTQTAGIRVAGYPNNNTIELYDGTNWTNSSGSLNTARYAGSYQGSQTAGFYAGGELYPPTAATDVTEIWDGTSMTTSPATLATIQKYQSGSKGSPSTAGWICGGQTPAATNNTTTQEYNSSVNAITAAAWASGPTSINTTSEQNAGTDGPSSAYAVWGGRTIPATDTTLCEEFDGTSFSAGGALNTGARTRCGGGTLTAAWCANGEQPAYISNVEEYNGTSWTEVTDTPAASSLQGGAGPQTSGVAVAGQIPSGPYPRIALEYDGTNWTTGGATNTSRTSSSAGMVGTSTNALICGGEPTPIANTETYDGSSWTEVADMVTALGQCTDGTFGTTSAAIQCGGKTSPSPGNAVTTAQTWNGTNWATSPNLGQARKSHSTSGATTAGFIAKGQTAAIPTALTSSEEFTAETSALNVKTLTQS